MLILFQIMKYLEFLGFENKLCPSVGYPQACITSFFKFFIMLQVVKHKTESLQFS
jgi:hypothetical protein